MSSRTSFAAFAIAALFLLTALPSPPVQARNVEVCLMRGVIQMEGNDKLGLDVDDGIWPRGGVWNPHPPWEGYADFYGSADFDGRCASATAGVGAFGLSFETDPPRQSGAKDSDGDGMGDDWSDWWEQFIGMVLQPLVDTDDDGLLNVREFQWQLVPVCLPYNNIPLPDGVDPILNCDDHEADPLTGSGGDGWFDGPEVAYWNNPQNDNIDVSAAGVAFYDPDRLLDTDGDLVTNLNDTDADNDNLLDGAEANTYHSYPELLDSDCAAGATTCTRSGDSSLHDPARQGAPGSRDGLNDDVELAMWNAISPAAWSTDYDADGIASNLLDPDADGDGLLDGEEILLWLTKPHVRDTDLDGLIDGDEVHIHQTNPADWDSDDDGMPDGWEADHHLNPRVHDAALDADADALPNGGEYAYARPGGWNEVTQGPWTGGTNPLDADSEGDGLQDGPEVLTHLTKPLHWDTDLDGLPDPWEIQYGFNPRNVNNAQQDLDGDSFDQGGDGIIEKLWPNVEEYRYARPADWDEFATGPWQLGTDPTLLDTDGDSAMDGYEAHFGTDARIPIPEDSDDDQDGLTWAQEAKKGTNPVDADTDGDGLCDGGRALNCVWPSGAGSPGERDYESIPWDLDSDNDGRSDDWEVLKWDPGASGSAQDVDGDLLNGVIDFDSDNDRLGDGREFNLQTDMAVPDTDADGLTDGDEILVYLTDPKDDDHDNDGLKDGVEVQAHHTRPKQADTDGDGLSDGAEVLTHATNPLAWDSDWDRMPDAWEVTKGTQATVKDTDKDLDADDLNNYREYQVGTHPNDSDSDDDGMPDGYEVRYGLIPTSSADKFTDFDSDGLSNFAEFEGKTNPANADTDGDGRNDGWEKNTGGTDPLAQDTDLDGFNDGPEYDAWIALSYPWSGDADGDTLNGLQDADSDNDGLSDFDELTATRSRPHDADTDDDTLSDFDEVVTYHGWFDPTKADTDGDGIRDDEEPKVDPLGDEDVDGLNNQDELNTYGTNYQKSDSDCDGTEDGPELTYWGASWNTGSNRLLTSDVDGDGLKDGVELGTVGTPSQAMYKTDPAASDSDADGLSDFEEATNNVEVQCEEASSEAMDPPMGPLLPLPALPTVPVPLLYKTMPNGLVFGSDENGWYIRGGYGVRLYLVGGLSPDELAGGDPRQPMSGPGFGTNGELTHPTQPDSDGDSLLDGYEKHTSGSTPTVCDSDGDQLGDALELGVEGATDPNNACLHRRDPDSSRTTDPLDEDSDDDGQVDGLEDLNRNGLADGLPTVSSSTYCGLDGAEIDPTDADSDDDGISDGVELAGSWRGIATKPFCFDSDFDGLSDGLEQGVTAPIIGTVSRNVLGISWPTYQDFPTLAENSGSYRSGNAELPILTPVDDADQDDDGLVDGLEDVNHNARFGLDDPDTSVIGARELSPLNSPDFDLDGLSDGLELRIWSKTFEEVVGSSGWTFSQLRFDGDSASALYNPYETDPRNANTDYNPTDDIPDIVPDGRDINPRDNALFHFSFERETESGSSYKAFRIMEEADGCCGDNSGWKPDPWFELRVKFLGSESYFETGTVNNVYLKDWERIPENPLAELPVDTNNWPLGLFQTWQFVDGITKIPTIVFDIPDNIGEINTNPTQATIDLTLRAYDEDVWVHDPFDFKAGSDANGIEDREIRKTINLMEETTKGIYPGADNPYMGLGTYALSQGNDNGNDGDGDVEAAIGYKTSENVPRYFLENILSGDALAKVRQMYGSCIGTVSCT